MQRGCHPQSLLVFDGQACPQFNALQLDFPVEHKSLRGVIRGGLKLTRCWVVAWSNGKPVVGELPLDVEVDFIAAKAPKKRTVHEDSVVIRASCAQKSTDNEKWKKIVHKPGAAIRDWIARTGGSPADLLDCRGWDQLGVSVHKQAAWIKGRPEREPQRLQPAEQSSFHQPSLRPKPRSFVLRP
ncbi:unnamed protein product [Symbiodinium necroappetens]|uniref:Uncharacterized protein n=1 Tax=Symbiodinium necroappetens TaxID=1628268 RepID=A0A813C242_9DINO|nr:unnamed protein product [Symbiodinium sp. CCMP2456]CAE7932243.1 unnamed protein product [Symbiodinium necroappetens]